MTMLYSQEELPESVFKSLLSAPYARRIFMRSYNQVWRRHTRVAEHTRNELAVAEAWKAVKEAYGLAY